MLNRIYKMLILGTICLLFISQLTAVYGSETKVVKTNLNGIPVLDYHHILRENENLDKGNSAIISLENFQAQMKLLHDNGYRTVTLEQLEHYVKGEITLPEKSIAITFDDGYQSNYIYAYPLLKQYGFHAAVFLITKHTPDKPETTDPSRRAHMSKSEISESRDVFEFGCHTYDLHKMGDNKMGFLLQAPPEVIADDLLSSKGVIDTKYYSYPYGQYNSTVTNALKASGYKMAFTIKPGNIKPGDNTFELKRKVVLSTTSIQEFKKMIGIKQTP